MPSRCRESSSVMACPEPVWVAIWGLETDYGAGLGGYSTLSALATLAYDCRRAQIYRAELIDALCSFRRGSCGHTAGRLGGRDRPHPVHAVGLSEIRRQRSRGRRRRHHFQSRPTRWPRPRISSARRAGARARAGTKASRTSTPCCNGTRPRSTPRRSPCSPTSWRRRNNRAAQPARYRRLNRF